MFVASQLKSLSTIPRRSAQLNNNNGVQLGLVFFLTLQGCLTPSAPTPTVCLSVHLSVSFPSFSLSLPSVSPSLSLHLSMCVCLSLSPCPPYLPANIRRKRQLSPAQSLLAQSPSPSSTFRPRSPRCESTLPISRRLPVYPRV